MIAATKRISFVVDSRVISTEIPSMDITGSDSPESLSRIFPRPWTERMAIYEAIMIFTDSCFPIIKLYAMTIAKKTIMRRSQVRTSSMKEGRNQKEVCTMKRISTILYGKTNYLSVRFIYETWFSSHL
jgi:hypothetical protein